MTRKINQQRSKQLITDILAARFDLMELAGAHGLSPEDLAGWVGDPAHLHCLAGLCLLADMQTQLLLSRYRSLAAGRLIKLATEEDNADVARRACVDLLRLDLKRVQSAGDGEDQGDDPPLPLPRRFYSPLTPPPQPSVQEEGRP